MAIKGAPVAAPKNAPMPTKVNKVVAPLSSGQISVINKANKWPKAAPTNSVGVNTPPTAPEPTVRAVAITLKNKMTIMACQVQVSLKSDDTTLKPLPATKGKIVNKRPNKKPPTLKRSGNAKPICRNSWREAFKSFKKSGATTPANKPNKT